MMRLTSALATAVAAASAATLALAVPAPASAQARLSDDAYWVVLASRQDPAEAIALARGFRDRFEAVHVAAARNGWYAITAGPIAAPDARAVTAALRAEPALPDDLFLSDGARFEDPFWSADRPRLERLRYRGDGPLEFSLDGLTLALSPMTDSYDMKYPGVVGVADGEAVFDLDMSEAASFSAAAWITVAPLDPRAPDDRQIAVAAFSGGAHCCASTRIATPLGDGWAVVPGAMLDGDQGYAFEDLDGDGIYELLSVDQSFLYAYASYAESFAPIVIERFAGKKIVEVSDDPRFRPALEEDLARLELTAAEDPELWRSNGFLAAWVAAKARLGAREEAWARMLASYDRTSDWPLTVCRGARAPDGGCPDERPATFPEALEAHLDARGYRQS